MTGYVILEWDEEKKDWQGFARPPVKGYKPEVWYAKGGELDKWFYQHIFTSPKESVVECAKERARQFRTRIEVFEVEYTCGEEGEPWAWRLKDDPRFEEFGR